MEKNQQKFNVIKGKKFITAGYVWANYIPIIAPIIIDEEPEGKIMTIKEWLIVQRSKFKPSETIASRYAEKIINHQFFGLVNVAGINTK